MKKFKTLTIMSLCICLVASAFAGCTKKVSLEGTWRTTIDMSTFVKSLDASGEEEGEFFGTFDEPLSVDLIFTFDEENNCTFTLDEEKFHADYYAMCEKYYDYFLEGIYKMSEAKNISRQDFEEYHKKDYGKSIRESIIEDQNLDESYNHFVKGFQQTEKQPWRILDGKVYYADETGKRISYETVVIEDDTFTITGKFDINGNPIKDGNFVYPMVFTKQTDIE